MLRPRIIPCLLIRDKGLVKTVHFKESRYIGDPLNAVRIFNEKQVDELIVLDIDATKEKREPDYKLIRHLAAECRMPFCYGGGINSVAAAEKIFSLGVEKIAISTGAMENPDLVRQISEKVGSQSVAVVLDVKRKLLGGYEVYTRNATHSTGKGPAEMAAVFENLGAGEIIVNSIDRDGTLKGYDNTLNDKVFKATTVPLTLLGGAGSLEDIGTLISRYGAVGAAAGSLFVFKGTYKAVLINYPNPVEKDKLIDNFYSLST